jgi:uncharacterized membrane-anchored protein
MRHDRGQFSFQRLLLDLQASEVLLKALSGDLDVMRRTGYRDHVILSSSTLCAAPRLTCGVARYGRGNGYPYDIICSGSSGM